MCQVCHGLHHNIHRHLLGPSPSYVLLQGWREGGTLGHGQAFFVVVVVVVVVVVAISWATPAAYGGSQARG